MRYLKSRINRLIPIKLLSIIFMGIIYSPRGISQQIQEAAFKITESQLQKLNDRLPKLTEDKAFYRWTNLTSALKKLQAGRVSKEELDVVNTFSSDRKQTYGAGVYLAENPVSSSEYGFVCLVFEIKKGTPIYSDRIIRDVFGKDLTQLEMMELGKKINFIRSVGQSSGWWVTHHQSNVNTVKFLKDESIRLNYSASVVTELSTKIYRELSTQNTEAASWIKKFLNLIYYSDGIQLLRAMRINPETPWAEFEKEKFDAFQSLREEALLTAEKSQKSILNFDFVGTETSEERVNRLIDKELKYVYQRLNATDSYNFRGNTIRAGGTLENGKFYASPKDLYYLVKNPYLDVSYTLAKDKKGFLVSYHYPSADHWKQVENKLSPTLVQSLQRATPNQKDNLTQSIIKELLKGLFGTSQKHEGKFVEEAFLQKFISIHPFTKLNGEISRLFAERVDLSDGKGFPPSFLSNVDLMTSEGEFKEILEASKKAYGTLITEVIREYLSATSDKRMAEYDRLPGWSRLVGSLTNYGIPELTIRDADYEDIKQRRFNDVFDRHYGEEWRFSPSADAVEIIQFAKKSGVSEYSKIVLNGFFKTIDLFYQDSTEFKESPSVYKYVDSIKFLLKSRSHREIQDKIIAKILTFARPSLSYRHFHAIEEFWISIFGVKGYKRVMGEFYEELKRNSSKGDFDKNLVSIEIRKLLGGNKLDTLFSDIMDGNVTKDRISKELRFILNHSIPSDSINQLSIKLVLEKMDLKNKVQYLSKFKWGLHPDKGIVKFYANFVYSIRNNISPTQLSSLSASFALTLPKYIQGIRDDPNIKEDEFKKLAKRILDTFSIEFYVTYLSLKDGNTKDLSLIDKTLDPFYKKEKYSAEEVSAFISFLKSEYSERILNHASKKNILVFLKKQSLEDQKKIIDLLLSLDKKVSITLDILKYLASSGENGRKMIEGIRDIISDNNKQFIIDNNRWDIIDEVEKMLGENDRLKLYTKFITFVSDDVMPAGLHKKIAPAMKYFYYEKLLKDAISSFSVAQESFVFEYLKYNNILDIFSENEFMKIAHEIPIGVMRVIVVPRKHGGRVDQKKLAIMSKILDGLPPEHQGLSVLKAEVAKSYIDILKELTQSMEVKKTDINNYRLFIKNALKNSGDVFYSLHNIHTNLVGVNNDTYAIKSIIDETFLKKISIMESNGSLNDYFLSHSFMELLFNIPLDNNTYAILRNAYVSDGAQEFERFLFPLLRYPIKPQLLRLLTEVYRFFPDDKQKRFSDEMFRKWDTEIDTTVKQGDERGISRLTWIYLSFALDNDDFIRRKKDLLELLDDRGVSDKNVAHVKSIGYASPSGSCSALFNLLSN